MNLHKYFFPHAYRNPSKLNLCASCDQNGWKKRFCCWISLCHCSRAAFSALQNLPGRSASKSSPKVTLSHIHEQLNSRPSLKGLPAPAALSVLKFNISPLVLKLQTSYLPFWLFIKVVKEQNQRPLSSRRSLWQRWWEKMFKWERTSNSSLCLFPQKILFKHQLSESSLISVS